MPDSISVEMPAAFTAYLKDMEASERTITGYLADLRAFAAWFEHTNGQPLSPQGLTAIDAREYKQHLLVTKRASAASVNRALAALRAYAASLVHGGALATNPLMGVRGVAQQRLQPKSLDKPDQAKFMREIEQAVNAARTAPARQRAIRDRAIVWLLAYTGLRVGELCTLTLADVTLTERKGKLAVRGKGDKQRTVPLNTDARRVLADWLKVCPAGHWAVFVGQKGRPLRPRGVERMIADNARRAGVQVTPHTLRHTFAKRLVDVGVSLDRVAVLLGHSNLNTTRIYTVPGERDLERAVELLE